MDTIADISKIKKQLNWRPKISILDGLKSML
jgi:nucleoside-diphosphate-sugar epimerase